MPLRIRRGTDAERLTITPLEGELIYTTDTKLVYVGDGTTNGGIGIGTVVGSLGGPLGQNLDLNGFEIVGLGNINITGDQTLSNNLDVGGNIDAGGNANIIGNLAVGGTITAQGNIIANGNITLGAGGNDIIVIDGEIDSNLIPGSNTYSIGSSDRPWGTLYVNGVEAGGLITGEFEGNVRALDSSIAFDANTSTFNGTFNGTLVGSVFGPVEGDVTGSLFSDNSTLRVSGVNNYVSNGVLEFNEDRISSLSNFIRFGSLDDPFPLVTEFNMPLGTGIEIYGATTNDLFTNALAPAISVNTFRGAIGSVTPLGANDVIFSMNFNGSDTANDVVISSQIIAVVDNNLPVGAGEVPGKLVFITAPNQIDYNLFTFDSSGKMAINKYDATETLDVEGNGLFSGSVTAAAFKGSVVADDSSIIVDGVSGSVNASSVTASTFVQFPVYSNPTTRDAAIPSPAAGMVVFVTDSTGAGGPPKLQANTDGTTGGWVDL